MYKHTQHQLYSFQHNQDRNRKQFIGLNLVQADGIGGQQVMMTTHRPHGTCTVIVVFKVVEVVNVVDVVNELLISQWM